MENSENARYIVLANVNGKKTAIQLDGLYKILPPQNFPPELPKEIHYKGERLPLYDAKEIIEGETSSEEPGSHYETMYRDLLGNVKSISDEIASLKKNVISSVEKDLTQITENEIPATSGQLTSIITATEEAANNIMDLTEKVQESQSMIKEKCDNMLGDFKIQEEKTMKNMQELEEIKNNNDELLTNIVTSLSFQDLTGQQLQKVLKLQDTVENKLVSILFNFGIKLRKQEDPGDESIKRGEEMLDLLQGEKKEAVNQNEVDELLSEFLK